MFGFLKRKVKERAMNAVILAVIRNGLKMGGMAGLFSDSQVNEAAGALSLILGLAWTGYNTWKEQQAKQGKA